AWPIIVGALLGECPSQAGWTTASGFRISGLSYEEPAPMRYGSRRPALQICRAAAGDGSVLAWSPWTVDECDCPRLFFRPERIHGLRARYDEPEILVT